MSANQCNARGFTLIASLMMLLLLSGIAMGLMYLVNTETRVGSGDLENTLAFHAAEGGMEKMTADLANLFSSQQAPTAASIANLQNFPPIITGITYPAGGYSITVPQNPDGTFQSRVSTISSGPNAGLIAQIIPMTLSVTAQRPLGQQVRMYRNVEVALIPVFQFGVFSEGDLSYYPGPAFDFAGRVHTNGNLFIADGTSLQLHSKVSAVREVIRAELANGFSTSTQYAGPVYIPRAPGGCDISNPPAANCRSLGLTEGSKVGGPTSANNTNWTNISTGTYNGWIINGTTGATTLSLPFVGGNAGPVQIIRRPAPNELAGSSVGASRLYNQAQIRVLISDDPRENHADGSPVDNQDIELASQVDPAISAFRPGSAAGSGTAQAGVAVAGVAGVSYFGEARPAAPAPFDADFVKPRNAYGVQNPAIAFPAAATHWPLIGGWLRVEIQRADSTWMPVTAEWLGLGFARGLLPPDSDSGIANGVHPRAILIFQQLADRNNDGDAADANECQLPACYTGNNSQYVWYPINFYEPREGEARDNNDGVCRANGIMNTVELDVANLKAWLAGTFGGNGALTDSAKQNGYVLYYSDRRGMLPDLDTNPAVKTGESGLEDIINSANGAGTPDGILETAEDVDGSSQLDRWGAVNIGDGFGPLNTTNDPFQAVACTTRARKNQVSGARHALRLVNGSRGNLPVRSVSPLRGGFTVASENPVYVLGDYNAKTSDNAWVDAQHAAAAVIADAVTLLSNNWVDRSSWVSPTNPGGRTGNETRYRLAIAAGNNQNFPRPSWGGQDMGTDGGVHNFLRYIERWGAPLHYQGSLVSLYYAQYATGVFKCCNTVYSPPTRDYSFDTLFLNPDNLPPGTPMFRDVANVSYRQDFTPAP